MKLDEPSQAALSILADRERGHAAYGSAATAGALLRTRRGTSKASDE